MLLVRRPKAPTGFNRAVQKARNDIRDIVKAGALLTPPATPTSEQFVDKWSEFKRFLSEAQHGRCGYCDIKVLAGDDGTVDHYKPKAEILGLYDDESTWGTQTSHSASVEGRQQQPVASSGYHWLAYAWSNYVFACRSCNVKWKKGFFPTAQHPRCCPPRPKGAEEPLLMSCYRSLRPSEHLVFHADGRVEAFEGSRYGYETIRTVGLYREPLRDAREEKTIRTYEALKLYADGDDAQRQTAIDDLRRLGSAKYVFAGVVRSIVEQVLDESWEDFIGQGS